MACSGCGPTSGQDVPSTLGDVLDGIAQAPLANPSTSGNPGANVGTQLGLMVSAPTFGADTPVSSSPAVTDMWTFLKSTPAAPGLSPLKAQFPARYAPRLTWGGYPVGFVQGNRPPGVSYDVAPAVPGDNVSQQQYVANGGKGAAAVDGPGVINYGGAPTGYVISGTPRVPGTAPMTAAYLATLDNPATALTPGNASFGSPEVNVAAVPVSGTAMSGMANSALSMPMIAALAVIGLVLVMGGA